MAYLEEDMTPEHFRLCRFSLQQNCWSGSVPHGPKRTLRPLL